MPAKNTKYLTGKRNLIFSKEFFDEVRQTLKSDISDKDIRAIILASNEEMFDIVANSDDALKLPENLGYIATTRYKSNKQPIDFYNTVRLKKKIPLLNLHSFGYISHVKWFKKSEENFGLKKIYKLVTSRKLSRQVSKSTKEGKLYHQWFNSDFWNINKVNKKFNNKNG